MFHERPLIQRTHEGVAALDVREGAPAASGAVDHVKPGQEIHHYLVLPVEPGIGEGPCFTLMEPDFAPHDPLADLGGFLSQDIAPRLVFHSSENLRLGVDFLEPALRLPNPAALLGGVVASPVFVGVGECPLSNRSEARSVVGAILKHLIRPRNPGGHRLGPLRGERPKVVYLAHEVAHAFRVSEPEDVI